MSEKKARAEWSPWRGRPPVPERDDLPEGFCYVHRAIPDAVMDIRYAGRDNFMGRPADGYLAPFAILTRQAAAALAKAANEFRKQGLYIRVLDAYRPQRAVDHFVRWAEGAYTDPWRQLIHFPDFRNKRMLLEEGYIARKSSHSRGSAVDLTLETEAGETLDMGTCFDYFGVQAWHTCKNVIRPHQENRTLLKQVMTDAGFEDYEREWWHYRLKKEPFQGAFDFPVE